MERNKIFYKAFTKFAIEIGVMHGMSLKKTKEFILQEFEHHPYFQILENYINAIKPKKTSIKILLEDCLMVCEEFGPNREYLTLGLMLEDIVSTKARTTKKKEETKRWLTKFKEGVEIINGKVPNPPLYNVFLEARSIIEWASMLCLYRIIPKRIQGENKPVLLLPPYLGTDFSTTFVRKYLRSLGFAIYKWDLGMNMIRSSYIPKLEERLDDIFETHKEKVSIVGWSGGGMFAKIMANRHPDKVAQIITIGSPVWGIMELKTSINGVIDFLRGTSLKDRNERFIKEIETVPSVPMTCIYTKTDGIVPWKHCIEAETYRKYIKNIEVFGSHSGLGANATVLLSVANALSRNLEGKRVKGITKNIESMLFPKFWKKNSMSKVKNLFFRA